MKIPFLQVLNGLAPYQGGPLAAPVTIPLSSTNPYTLDFTKLHEEKPENFVQTLFVDNSQNDGDLLITTSVLNQPLRVPASSQGYVPILFGTSGVITFESSTTGPVDIYIALINMPMPLYFWQPSAVSGGGTIDDLIALQRGVYSDFSGTIATGGVSEEIIAANTSRKRILIQAPFTNSENIYINFTDAASAGGNSIELTPGASYDTGAFPVPTNAINAFGVTTGTAWMAKELA